MAGHLKKKRKLSKADVKKVRRTADAIKKDEPSIPETRKFKIATAAVLQAKKKRKKRG